MEDAKPGFRLFFRILLSLILVIVLVNYKLINYGYNQAKGQLHIIFYSVPVEQVINSPTTSDTIRDKLILTREIRSFAMDSLGLKNSKNYTTYYDQQNKPVMWVVTGCKPFELVAKEWWFPVTGKVSYKGFFNEAKAKAEEQLLLKEGYETDIYSPSAWSTLGYLKDPILSGMMKRGPGRLAELIIHELTHATVYLQSSVAFNENLATFIGEQGAEKFLVFRFGVESPELKRYQNFLEDENTYSNYMVQSSRELDSLYHSFTDNMELSFKAKLKYQKIASIMAGIRKLPLNSPERYVYDFSAGTLPNNTEFMAFLRYHKNQQTFREAFENYYHGDLRYFISDLIFKTEHNEPLPYQ